MKIRYCILLYLLFLLPYGAPAQTQHASPGSLVLDGLVYGYEYDFSRKLLKKNKRTLIEGVLEGVSINVLENDKSIYKTVTSRKGAFKLTLKPNSILLLELSKEGYSRSSLLVDTRNITKSKSVHGLKFSEVEFILNSFKSKIKIDELIGTLYFNEAEGCMDFKANENKKNPVLSNSVELMKRVVKKNRTNPKSELLPFVLDVPKSKIKNQLPLKDQYPPSLQTKPVSKLRKIFDFVFDGQNAQKKGYLSDKEKEIRMAKKKLAIDKLNAKTREDSLLILANEARIYSAESQLENAEKTIDFQILEIKNQKNLLFLSLGSLVLLLLLLSIVLFYYKEKRRINIILEHKNVKILDSISYAKRIQESILVHENEIQKCLPESFIYFKPKDIVSGDFYWFSHIGEKIIVAVIDCTGHGVPGAFMSLIANTLLNEIINEKHILEPNLILKQLHTGVCKVLHQGESGVRSQDGMEMALCVIDRKDNTLSFAGAMNPIYLVQGNSLKVIPADVRSIGGKALRSEMDNVIEFTNQVLILEKQTSIYLFTDGYPDQFGGENNKKFNTSRFKALLLNIAGFEMEKQKEILQITMNDWQKDYKQIDDILVLGIRI